MITSDKILQSYLIEAFNAKKVLHHRDLLAYNRQMRGGDFLLSLNFYSNLKNTLDPAIIPYFSPDRKDQLCHELGIALLLLRAEQEYEASHQKIENEKIYESQIKRCFELLDALNPARSVNSPFAYCGITLAQEFAKKITESRDFTTKTVKKVVQEFNEKRLYWVWGSSLIKTVLGLVPENLYNSRQARGIIKIPDPYFGILGWTLYYFRFFLNLFLLLKHTLKGPWMSEEEGLTPWYERFKTQWAERKFTLLNDSIWGTANLVCFFWLHGQGVLGTAGDALTLLLLVFDISVCLWDFSEQQTLHEARIQDYQEAINRLESAGTLCESETPEEKKLKAKQLQRQIDTLKREYCKCQKDWELQKLSLYHNIAYAVALMLAFILLTMPFMPVAAPTALILGAVGAVLCFAFTVISTAIKGGIDLYSLGQGLDEAENQFKSCIALFENELNPDQKKLLYLEIKGFHQQTIYQKQLIAYQTISLVRSIMLSALMPAIIFSCLVFLPLGIGFAALGATLGLAIATHSLIDALFKPDENQKKSSEFNEKSYRSFCDFTAKKNNAGKYHAFFKLQNKEPNDADEFNEDSSDWHCTIQ